MAEWQEKYPVEYSAAADETIDSWFQDYIAEINRIYQLLNRVRRNDSKAGEPDDTTPYQFHVDNVTDTLYMRNPAGTAWIPIGKLSANKDRFIFDRAIANNGGVTSLQIGKLADRPTAEVDNAIYIALDATATSGRRYRYSAALSQWVEMSIVLYADAAGKSHVQEADHAAKADAADHAEAATNAGYAASTQRAEIATAAERLAVPVDINGIPFDGTHSISIGVAGNSDGDVSAYQQLLWRTAQNEREISNVELALADENIFPDYNNLLVENFKNGSAETDQLTVAVTSIAAGDNSLDVSDLSQLKQGRIYTLSDGTQQEYVQIKDLIKSGTTYRVMLVSNTVNTYASLPALYRTTASVTTDGAEGTGSSKVYPYTSNTVWKGVNASTEVDIPLNTTAANAGAFTISGNIGFTAAGEITLV